MALKKSHIHYFLTLQETSWTQVAPRQGNSFMVAPLHDVSSRFNETPVKNSSDGVPNESPQAAITNSTNNNATIRALSYSLYGEDPCYWKGMINVAKRTALVFPDWQVWIYHDHSIPIQALSELDMSHVKLIHVEKDLPTYQHLNTMTWRFFIASDPTVDAFAIRDTDALPFVREYAAVEEWLLSGRDFHLIRDHPMHHPTEFSPILGGMWGGRASSVPNMDALFQTYYSNPQQKQHQHGDDQDFLWKIILPLAHKGVLQHDSYYCRESNAIGFPMSREESELDDKNSFSFVGNGLARCSQVD